MARRAHRISFSGCPRFAVAFTLDKFSLRFAELVETPALLTIYFIPEILFPFAPFLPPLVSVKRSGVNYLFISLLDTSVLFYKRASLVRKMEFWKLGISRGNAMCKEIFSTSDAHFTVSFI